MTRGSYLSLILVLVSMSSHLYRPLCAHLHPRPALATVGVFMLLLWVDGDRVATWCADDLHRALPREYLTFEPQVIIHSSWPSPHSPLIEKSLHVRRHRAVYV